MLRALLSVLVLALPGAAQEAVISTEATHVTDRRIATRLQDILDQIGTYEEVSVTVENGVVQLSGTATSLAEITELGDLAARVEGVVAVNNAVTETSDIVRRLNPAVERFQRRVEQLLIALPMAVIALAVAVVIFLVGHWLARRKRPWDRIAPNAFIADLYRQIVRLVFLLVGIVVALDILNATALLSTILGAAGIIGLALGFAVRDTVENFIASVLLSVRQPFEPNDFVEIEGDQGRVIRLTSRATILLSLDGNHVRIPNATVFKARIINFTRNPERRFSFEIGVASDADLAAIRTMAEDTLAELPFVLAQPGPAAWITRIGDGSVILTLAGWIDQRETDLALARGEALRQVKTRIEASGVEVPDTTYRVQMIGAPAPRPVAASSPSTPVAADPRRPDDVSAAQDAELSRMVAKERADPAHPDLLDDAAPQE